MTQNAPRPLFSNRVHWCYYYCHYCYFGSLRAISARMSVVLISTDTGTDKHGIRCFYSKKCEQTKETTFNLSCWPKRVHKFGSTDKTVKVCVNEDENGKSNRINLGFSFGRLASAYFKPNLHGLFVQTSNNSTN